MAQPALTELEREDLGRRLEGMGRERWRADQILRWVYRRRAASFREMTDLPLDLRGRLESALRVVGTEVVGRHASPDETEKLLLRLVDGDVVETVLIRERVRTRTGEMRERRTVCISTQVGCPVACVFCASGLNGLKRNLTSGEIVEQVLHAQRILPPGERISSLVLMGIGEPLLNYDAVTRALKTWKAAWGAGIGYNRVTLSTIGVLGRLRQLVRDRVTPNLALSLHAPNDEIRRRVVPTMPKASVREIARAGAEYKRATRKNVTFEYVLLAGINDAPAHARELGALVRGSRCKVNVIPFNRVEEVSYAAPAQGALDEFVRILGGCGVPVTVRKRKGDEVSAACGQLRARWERENIERRSEKEDRRTWNIDH